MNTETRGALDLYRLFTRIPEDEYDGYDHTACLIGHPTRMGELADEYAASGSADEVAFLADRFNVSRDIVDRIYGEATEYDGDLAGSLQMAANRLGLTEADIRDGMQPSSTHAL